ncbi:MAG: hypothetical protein WCE57_08800 [Salegentibacter sp.]
MRRIQKNYRKYLRYFLVLFLVAGITASCNDDDDNGNMQPQNPTGSITANDQTISQNTIMVQSVTVGQDSWLVARNAGEEDMAGIVSDPVMLSAGTTDSIELPLKNSANLTGDANGNDITLMLHVDDQTDGTQGSFDYATADGIDSMIQDNSGNPVSETITVYAPSFDVTDQDVTDNSVTFNSIDVANDSWVVLYNSDANGDMTDQIVGQAFVAAGSTDPVTVTFDDSFTYTPGQTLYAQIYTDNPADQSFTYPDDPTTDVPALYGYDSTGTGNYVTTSFVIT